MTISLLSARYTPSYIIPSENEDEILRLFDKCNDLDSVCCFLNEEFNTLSNDTKDIVLSYIEKNGMVQKAAKAYNMNALELLINSGANINAYDCQNKHCLNASKSVSLDLFEWLWRKGARLDHEKYPTLAAIRYLVQTPVIIKKENFFSFSEEYISEEKIFNEGYINEEKVGNEETRRLLSILTELFLSLPIGEATGLSRNDFDWMRYIPQCNQRINTYILEMSVLMPENVIHLGVDLLNVGVDGIQMFNEFFSAEISTDIFEAIFLSHRINLFYKDGDYVIRCFDLLHKWIPSEKVLELNKYTKNTPATLYLLNCLSSTTLHNLIRKLFRCCSWFFDSKELFPTFSKDLSCLIGELEKKAGKSFFSSLFCLLPSKEPTNVKNRYPNLKTSKIEIDIYVLFKLIGLHFDTDDVETWKKILYNYSSEAIKFFLHLCEANPSLRERFLGSQAGNLLEFYCLNIKVPPKNQSFYDLISLLAKHCRLSDTFPDVNECRNKYPDSLDQALYAILSNHDYVTLKGTYFKDREFRFKATEILSEKEDCKLSKNPDGVRRKFMKNQHLNIKHCALFKFYVPSKDWRKQILPDDHKRFLSWGEETPKTRDFILNFFASFWENEIPESCYNLMSEYPVASLALSALIRSTELKHSLCQKLNMFLSCLSPYEKIALARYFINNPEITKKAFSSKMRVRSVYIKSGGYTKSNFGKCFFLLMPKEKWMFSEKTNDEGGATARQYHLQGSNVDITAGFDIEVPPRPIAEVLVDKDASLELIGRTVLVKTDKRIDAFKFLKKGEEYRSFSQEGVVTTSFSESGLFQSSFHIPQGVYFLKELPAAFQPFIAAIGDGPYYIYHYIAPTPKLFVYLQNVNSFKECAKINLADAAKMNYYRVAQDIAQIYHNNKTKRKYFLFVDLARKLIKKYNGSGKYRLPAGGAGRVEQAFLHVRWPNMRETGLTDLRDADIIGAQPLSAINADFSLLPDNQNSLDLGIFERMYHLSKPYFVYMLLTVQRYKDEGTLDWQNEEFNIRFGEELLDGFAVLMSSYSQSDYDRYLKFGRECGIDWILAARQIAFWVDDSPKGYPEWIGRGEIPDVIYGKEVEVVVSVGGQENNLTSKNTFSTEGHQDIGIFNGPFACTEFEKITHFLYFSIVEGGIEDSTIEGLQPLNH